MLVIIESGSGRRDLTHTQDQFIYNLNLECCFAIEIYSKENGNLDEVADRYTGKYNIADDRHNNHALYYQLKTIIRHNKTTVQHLYLIFNDRSHSWEVRAGCFLSFVIEAYDKDYILLI